MSSIPITTRLATSKDVPVVAQLIHELLYELGDGNTPPIATIQNTTETLLDAPYIEGLLAEFDGRPIGVLMLNECAAIYAGGRFGEITELYVDPKHRSAGIAPQLLAAAFELARKKGWKRLEVGAPDQPAWARTLQFYLREGFEEVGPRLRKLV